MHKDISGVLTVSTCLLNRDRNSVSDFTETPPSPSHMCPSILNVASPCQWQYHWQPTLGKKEHVFRDVNQRWWKLKVRVARSLVGWHIRQPVRLPACSPACLFFLCTLWILAIHIVKLIMHFHIFPISRCGKKHSICQVGFYIQTVESQRVMHLFILFWHPEVKSCQGY